MFNPNLIQEVDPSTIEGSEAVYPLIQWSYGDPKLAKHGGAEGAGGWFISFDNIPGVIRDDLVTAMKSLGWTEDSITLGNGDGLDGLYSPTLTISVVNMRKRWRANDGHRNHYYRWDWDAYQKAVAEHGRATSQIHIYAIVKGLEEFAPFVITLSGSGAMAFEGSRKSAGALTTFQRTVIGAANARTKGARWPYRAFWLTLIAARDKAGKPKFTEVGSGQNKTHVVLPMADGLPADVKDVDLDKFALDKPAFILAQNLYTESVAWKAAWDRIGDDETSGGQSSAAPHVEEDDAVAAAMADSGL